MRSSRLLGTGLALLLAFTSAALAEEQTATAEQQSDGDRQAEVQVPARPIRLVQPWSRLSSLTDEQRQQIYEIRQQFLAELRILREKERQDVLALLNEQQKAELASIEQQQAEVRRMRDAERRAQQRAELIEQAADQSAPAGDPAD